MPNSGKFISLEGIEGCGKSTQARLLAQYIAGLGISVVLTREPGGTLIGERIRDILLDPANIGMTSITELMLYIASRAQHVSEIIMPALSDGKIVICERFSDATAAYQGFARGLDLKIIENLTRIAINSLEPDLTIVLDLKVENGLLRAKKRGNQSDRLESEDIEFHNKVRNGYLSLAREFPQRIKVVDGEGTVDEVHHRIRQCVLC